MSIALKTPNFSRRFDKTKSSRGGRVSMLAGNEAASPTPATNLTKEEASIMRQDSVPVAEREDGLGTFSKSM